MSAEDIEIAAQWNGEPGVFTNALSEVRFLDGQEGSFVVHDWAEHNPWAASRGQRIEASKIASAARWGKQAAGIRPGSESEPNRIRVSQNRIPHLPTQPTPTKKQSVSDAVTVLPDWIPSNQWNAFLEMRRTLRAPMGERAISLAISKLEGFRSQGYDLGSILDQSTMNSWRDLFPIKTGAGLATATGTKLFSDNPATRAMAQMGEER